MTILTFFLGFIGILILSIILWIISIPLKNVSIVDPFWGIFFVVAGIIYNIPSPHNPQGNLILILLCIWAFRLFLHLIIRNGTKKEDYRYQNFRKRYGKKYWWKSLFQTFILQAFLAWVISIPIFISQIVIERFYILDYFAILLWLVGFAFESISDLQLSEFKKNKQNKGKVLNTGLWKYSRHPNYFGNACIWWAFGLFALDYNTIFVLISPIIMTILLMKVSGVSLLEKDLMKNKKGYSYYIQTTNSFFPWPPKKIKNEKD
ncbi:MAG: DUF1295 domain-containing protein [Bacteroidales bacterium]